LLIYSVSSVSSVVKDFDYSPPKLQFILDNTTLMFYASFMIIKHLMY